MGDALDDAGDFEAYEPEPELNGDEVRGVILIQTNGGTHVAL